MPQIKINEIDQSVFTRVITDDYVRVVVPAITSFGPALDGTNINSVTFTDVTEYEKMFGYTEPEFNPFKYDVSRKYIKQLINKGAAVTVVRLNNGTQSKFNIGSVPTGSATTANLAPAVIKSEGYIKLVDKTTQDYLKEHSKTSVDELTEQEKTELQGKITALPATHPELLFCPQIKSIHAKYTGSFGNNLLVTFTPINSKNVQFAYQYSTVSVYRADVTATAYYVGDESNKELVVDRKITGIHKLESKIVTTNPNEPTYFENVNFDFIKIEGTPTAFDELSLIWSNTNVKPEANTTAYSGFPEVTLKTIVDNIVETNSDALLSGGVDFLFSDSNLMEILGKGFGGFNVITTDTSDKVTVKNINNYIWESYNPNGVVNTILTQLADIYENYSDPYIYDFDFITAGGFVDETYTITKPGVPNPVVITDKSALPTDTVVTAISSRINDNVPPAKLGTIHRNMLDLAETRGDCIAVIDTNPYWDASTLPGYVELLNSSYATVHAPWCYCNDPDAIGTVLMPPSFVFLYTMLANLSNNTEAQKWFPPAGVTRATARVVKKPLYEIGSVLLNAWQNDTLSRVNPIMKLKNSGYVIYGQYTSYTAINEFTHSALESLNVRLISNCVKKQIFNTCLKLAFEPNNASLWMRFYDSMDKYLLFMKRNDGLYDYRIVMDESTVTTDDINELRCPGKVYISPTRTAEFFDIDFIITGAGATFNEEGE